MTPVADDIVTRLRDWQDYNDGETLTSPSYALYLTLKDAAAEIKKLRTAGDRLAFSVRVGRWDDALDAWEEVRLGSRDVADEAELLRKELNLVRTAKVQNAGVYLAEITRLSGENALLRSEVSELRTEILLLNGLEHDIE